MKMFEAIEVARKTGKKIKRGKDHAVWFDDKLIWEGIRTCVMISNVNLDADWEVVEPPPKEYSFAEAFQLMKQGKRMMPSGGGFAYYFDGADWKVDGNVFKTPTFYPSDIDSKWIEVQP